MALALSLLFFFTNKKKPTCRSGVSRLGDSAYNEPEKKIADGIVEGEGM
jgi:hypothetical protein